MQLIIKDKYVDYIESMAWFDDIKDFKKNSDKDIEKIFILEHNNVYTAGKSITDSNKKTTIHGVPVFYTNRGGLWTWHGRGQIVIYFIYNLHARKLSLHDFMSKIETIIVDEVKKEIQRITKKTTDDVNVYSDNEKRGFWVKFSDDKIFKFGFIGLRVSNGFVYHGVSINYDNDLAFFDYITPCGLKDVKITSIKEITKKYMQNNLLDIEIFKKNIGNALFKNLNLKF